MTIKEFNAWTLATFKHPHDVCRAMYEQYKNSRCRIINSLTLLILETDDMMYVQFCHAIFGYASYTQFKSEEIKNITIDLDNQIIMFNDVVAFKYTREYMKC